ncbi:MAG: adenine deaminase [Lentihominibacter sp.]|jgi:adenine deaminase
MPNLGDKERITFDDADGLVTMYKLEDIITAIKFLLLLIDWYFIMVRKLNKSELKELIEVSSGREKADLLIKNCKVVDVYNSEVYDGDIAIVNGLIAGVGEYEAEKIIDADGAYAVPGFIDAHIHIESSYLSPEELGRLIVPCGTTTIIADPHEIVNVCGIDGLDYMLEASEKTALDVKMMLPSCVPATPFENAGAVIDAKAMQEPIKNNAIPGLGEFMDFVGVTNARDDVLDKLLVAYENNKIIDGHSPGLSGNLLNAYASAGIMTDHECSAPEEMIDRIRRGMYVQLRQGSACHDLQNLIEGLTPQNSRRCLLCSDDRQPKTIFKKGHLDDHLRICVNKGVDPVTAIQMASLNAAECYRLHDRGAIAPGLRADIVLLDNLEDFNAERVFIKGKEAARDGEYLPSIEKYPIDNVRGRIAVKGFSKDKLKLSLKSGKVNIIDIMPGGVLTAKGQADIELSGDGDFAYNPKEDIVKVAVVERHQNTGNVAVALLRGYGIKEGAIAVSVAHDSHNIIVVGVNDDDMAFAVEKLIQQEGGIVLIKDSRVVESMPMEIGGIMSSQSGEWVSETLRRIHNAAHRELKVNETLEPVMVLTFMSLAVIPEIKLTDMGLFDVTRFEFVGVERE